MEKFNFDFLKAGINEGRFETVAKAAKVSDEIRPELVVNISINKMCINGLGRKLFCSYAACYSQFLQNTPDAQAITADKLAELGYAYGIDKKDSEGKPYTKYTANREVHYELVDTGIDYPNSDGSMLRIWACVNAQIIDRPYDPSVEAETAADDAENKKTDAPETVADTANAETASETQDETAASQETAGDGDDI